MFDHSPRCSTQFHFECFDRNCLKKEVGEGGMQLAELAKDLIFYLRAGAVCVSKRSCRAKREIMHPFDALSFSPNSVV